MSIKWSNVYYSRCAIQQKQTCNKTIESFQDIQKIGQCDYSENLSFFYFQLIKIPLSSTILKLSENTCIYTLLEFASNV